MMTNRTYKSGQSREQASFLPPCLEDYVGRDNPVRAIDAYVDSLDLNGLGFRAVGSDGGGRRRVEPSLQPEGEAPLQTRCRSSGGDLEGDNL
jgi:hypothetical protein